MKRLGFLVGLFLGAVLVLFATHYFSSKQAVEHKETTFDRVVRTGKLRCSYLLLRLR